MAGVLCTCCVCACVNGGRAEREAGGWCGSGGGGGGCVTPGVYLVYCRCCCGCCSCYGGGCLPTPSPTPFISFLALSSQPFASATSALPTSHISHHAAFLTPTSTPKGRFSILERVFSPGKQIGKQQTIEEEDEEDAPLTKKRGFSESVWGTPGESLYWFSHIFVLSGQCEICKDPKDPTKDPTLTYEVVQN